MISASSSRFTAPFRSIILGNCHTSEIPIFAKDINEDGAKSFFQCGYNTFLFHHYPMYSEENRHFYEVLRCDLPTKLFFDIESTTIRSEQTFQEIIDMILMTTRSCIAELFQVPMLTVYHLDSSSDEKKSVHLIFDFFLENIDQVKQLAHEIRSKCNHEKSMDMGVYSKNRCFRLLGSSKKGSGRVLQKQNRDPITPTDIFNTMIQAHAGSLPVYSFKESTVIHRTIDRSTCIDIRDLPHSLVEYIQALGGAIRSAKSSEESIDLIVSGMFCPYARRVHRSNNMYFTVYRKTKFSFFTCADMECSRCSFWRDHLSWIEFSPTIHE